jgi:hypothetical protein
MTWLNASTSHDASSSALAEKENSGARKISAMAGNGFIRRGQLNRTDRHCQAGFDFILIVILLLILIAGQTD